MRECLSCRRLDRWPRFAVATALMLFACSSASLKALTLPGVTWSAVYEFTSESYSDGSGNGNTLSVFTGSSGFAPDRSGSSSSAFQGTTGRILGKSGALANFNPSSNQLTLSAWIKTTSSGKEVIATMGRNKSSNEGEWIWGISSGKLYFWDYRGGYGFVETSVSTTSVNNGQWRHVAFVRNELNGTFYVDGAPAGTVTAAANISYTNSDLVIGGDYRDGTLYWTGQLDDISVTSTALTPAQIQLLASVPGVETGPTNSISGLTQTSVNLMGGITNLGGTTVTNAGFYLNTNSPATNGVKYSAPGTSFGLGSFSNTITGLTPGTRYTYRAFAANSVGTGYGANEYSFTTLPPAAADTDEDGLTDAQETIIGTSPTVSQIPRNLLAQQPGPNGFVATWGVVSGAAGYEVQVSTEPTFTTGLVGGDRPVSLGTTTSLGITGISGQIRYYRVRSVLPSQDGPLKTAWSPAVSAPDRSAFGKYATLNATGNADNFQPATNSSPNNNSYTITFWMRPDRLGGVSGTENVQVVRQGISSSNGWANVDLDLLPGGSLSFGQKDGTQQKTVTSAPSSILASNWYHVALVRDATNSTLKLYLNGSGVATNTNAFGLTNWTINNSTGFAASQDALNDDGNTNRFRGAMDDVRVYRTVRTSVQILEDVRAPLAVAAANADSTLVFYAPMEGTSLGSTDTNSFFKGDLNGSAGTITSQSVLTAPVLTWTPSPINLVAPAVLSTSELTATATAPTGGPVSGSWSYLPAAGTSLSIGTNAVVGTFVPTDLVTYAIGTITNQIVVTAAAKGNPAVTVTTGSYNYNGSYQGPGVSEVNKGGSTGAVTLQYGGNAFGGAVYGPSNTPPTDAGNYTVVATVAEDANYNQASSSPTAFTIAKATATMTLGSLDQTYNGSPKPVTVTPNPVGVSFTVQYDGESTVPINAGDYLVLVTVNDPNYSGSSAGTLKISKATPLLSGITATAITQGQTLSASTVTGTAKNAGVDVDGRWSFQNPGDTPALGTSDHGVIFTPTDTTNYEAVSVAASVTVTAALAFTYEEAGGEITITGFTGTGGNVVIPGTILGKPVTSIAGGAFLNSSSITSVTIPSGVTTIGGSAFKDCGNLTSVTIPGSVTSIGSFAFSGCDGLTSITLGNNVANIGESTFSGCSSLSSIIIPSSVNSIGKQAFYNCSGLTAITIPSSVITVGEEAFNNCYALESVAIGSGVTTIGSSAFLNCRGLTSLTIPDNVTSLGNSAFTGCRGLTSLTIGSGVTSIAGSTFLGCTSLTSVTIPNSVTSLGIFAFAGCTSLTTITIGSGVTSIGEKAFQGCTNLASLTIPNNVTSMGNLVFFQCYGLTSVEIASGVTIIAPGTFSSCTSLTSVTIPNTVTTIGAQAFRDCTNLTSITIPSSVANINSDAFNGCTNLAAVNFERTSPPTIGSNVFTNIKPSAIGYYPVGAALWSGVTINGLTLTPAVSPKLNQTITFNATPVLTWNGLNSKVVLDARVDSGLPLSFVSSNSQVATVTTDAQVTTVCNLGGSTPSENWAMGLAVDASDNVYVAAQDVTVGNNQSLDKIFKISDGTSVPVVFVGLGNDKPRFLAAHDGYLYVTTSAGVGKVPLTGGSIQYLQLTGTDGSTPHPFTSLSGIAVGAEGNIWVADGDARAIYKFNSAGVLQQGWAVGWNAPQGLAISPSGDVYVANTVSHEIKKIDPTTGAVTTVAGTGLPGYADGDGTVAQFIYPQGIAFDKEGNLMVVDQQNYRIRKIAFGPSGATVSSLAGGGGSGQASPALDGLGTAAGFNFQIGIGVDSKGNIFSAEGNAKNIRKTRMVGVATIQGAGSATITASQAGNADYAAAAPVTIPVSVTLNAALISSGFSHTLYLGAGATTVTAWGLNTDGRLGVGDTNSPVNWARTVQGIPANVEVEDLAAGGTHSLILAGGEVYAAGSDRYGQLGQGGTNRVNRSSFVKVFGSPSNPVIAVSAGGNHSLMVTASGSVFACGDNAYGQLAQPATNAISASWLEINFPGRTNRIVSVVAGADHNLAVDENGGVWVWGRNNYGQLGKGTRTAAERTPSKLDGVTARSVAAGFSHSLILETSGTVRGFGRNNVGQAGQDTSYVTTPTPIEGLVGIESIAAGTDSSFAIDGAGQLRAWGYNAYGELLLGYASPSSSPGVYGPTPSPIATRVSKVAGGGYSTLAAGVQGVIFGGRNDVGQAGNGPDPKQVVGDYYYEAGDLTLTNLTMDLAGTIEDPLYDQIFAGSGAVTLNGILNLMFVGSYTGPVFGTPQTFDLIWARDGIVLGTGYQLAFNQAGYLVESAVIDKSVEGESGKVLQATVRAVVTAGDLAKAVDLARPSLDGVESVSYGGSSGVGIRTLSVSSGVEMIYSYERPTGGVSSGAQYFVNGITYRVGQVSSLNNAWEDASVSGTTVTPLGKDSSGLEKERVTLRISSSGETGFLQLQVESPQANGISAGVGGATSSAGAGSATSN